MKSFNEITRRDFLKSLGLAAAATTFGCATTERPETRQTTLSSELTQTEPIVYPPLPGKKIQPPENGCLTGFYKQYLTTGGDYAAQTLAREFASVTERAKDYDELKKFQEPLRMKNEPLWVQNIKNNINRYGSLFGKKPYAYVVAETSALFLGFPEKCAPAVAEEGVVPFIHAKVDAANPKHSMRLEDIVRGKHDKLLINFSKAAVEFGQKHGGFFIMTMPEPNGSWFYWNSSNFVPTYKHIWQIFEDQGANQYATWVWKIYCPGAEGVPARDPEQFYPGDKYVDWIGLSAVSKPRVNPREATFDSMIYSTYTQIHKSHPQKPIMQTEFGRTDRNDQARWLTQAYNSIKNDFPAMKAAIYYGFVGFGHDSNLNQKSLESLKEIFKDPYWIMAK